MTTAEYPLILITGRNLYHFNAGTMTLRTGNTALDPTDLLEIFPEEAAKLELTNGDTVRVISRYGEARLPIKVTFNSKQGEVFTTFHTPEIFLNYVTGPYQDSHTRTPEFKVTAVRLEKV